MNAVLTLWSREECELCTHFLDALQPWLARHAPQASLTVRDVDDDPDALRRFGLRVPVLLLDGQRVCEGRFDPAELQRLLRPR